MESQWKIREGDEGDEGTEGNEGDEGALIERGNQTWSSAIIGKIKQAT